MKKMPQKFDWLEYPLCALLAALFVMPTRIMVGNLSVALMDSVGVYFSLLCVSSLLFAAREKTREEEPVQILLDLLRMWLGAALVMILVGTCREILGNGTIWNKPLTWMKVRFSGVMVSGIGFILLGFLAALGKKIHRLILAGHLMTEKYIPIIKEKLNKSKNAPEEAETQPEQAEESSAEQLVQEITDTVMRKEQE